MQGPNLRHDLPSDRSEHLFAARKETTASPETREERVRLRCQALIEGLWEGKRMERMTDEFFDEICEAPEADVGIYTPEKRRDAAIFFDTIYTWARAHRDEGEKMLAFSQGLYDTFFSMNPLALYRMDVEGVFEIVRGSSYTRVSMLRF